MRLLPLLALAILLCTCGPAMPPPPTPPAELPIVAANVRYQEDGQRLSATMTVPSELLPNGAPTLYGTTLSQLANGSRKMFRGNRQLPLPGKVEVTVPSADGHLAVSFPFAPVFLDSLPAVLDRKASVRFPFSNAAMTEDESLVVFFEPTERSTPRRLQIVGPTQAPAITIPTAAIASYPAGDYDVYLVKQSLVRDSSAYVKASVQTEYYTATRRITLR